MKEQEYQKLMTQNPSRKEWPTRKKCFWDITKDDVAILGSLEIGHWQPQRKVCQVCVCQ